MSRCKQCNIEVLDETERCPLCHSVLEPTIEVENMYPDVKIKTRRMMLLSRIYLFVAIVAEAVLVAVNHYGDFETAWSLVTGLIFFYGYLVVRFAILGKTGYIAKTIVLTLIAILILIAIDFVNGYRGWSVRYVFPAAIILVDAGILILMCVNRTFERRQGDLEEVLSVTPEELAELYYVADFYDFVQFCSDYSVSDRNYLCAVSGARGTRNVCIFVPWNADHR